MVELRSPERYSGGQRWANRDNFSHLSCRHSTKTFHTQKRFADHHAIKDSVKTIPYSTSVGLRTSDD